MKEPPNYSNPPALSFLVSKLMACLHQLEQVSTDSFFLFLFLFFFINILFPKYAILLSAPICSAQIVHEGGGGGGRKKERGVTLS